MFSPLRRAQRPRVHQVTPNTGSDYLCDDSISPAPVGGRLSLHLSACKQITRDVPFSRFSPTSIKFRIQKIFQGFFGKTPYPREMFRHFFPIQAEIEDLILKNAIVQKSDRFSVFVPSSDICYPQELRGSLGYFKPLTNQSVHSCSALQDGNSERLSSAAIQPGLGGDHRFEGRLLACFDSPAVASPAGFFLAGPDVPLQGTSFRAVGLALSVHQTGGHGH